MSTTLETLNSARETTITDHYNAALAELKAKVAAEPLRTKFNIYSGCPSKEITAEVARRLTTVDIEAKASSSGWFRTRLYLEVTVALPKSLSKESEPAPQ